VAAVAQELLVAMVLMVETEALAAQEFYQQSTETVITMLAAEAVVHTLM